MGNICNGNFEKDDNTETVDTVNKNYTVFLCKLNV